ncbi:MAG: LysM peptidoglycan-binding domain-containing protein [Chloroflexi bacterium]|nr:MAG: LysM peptidoglycan-binding domain-containing protein [Chloroflexota bacterium]
MSLNLPLRPRRNRRRLVWWLLLLAAVTTALALRQKGLLPTQATAQRSDTAPPTAPPPAEITPPAALKSAPVPQEADPPPAVIAGTAESETAPDSDAYTSALYSAEQEGVPWPNAGGRTRIETYTVQEGDTLWSIAAQYGLDIDTLRWSNPELERNPDILSVGMELRILPVIGVYHVVEAGDTVATIAQEYGVSEEDITAYPPNGLYPPYNLKPGQGIIVPFGRKNPNLPPPDPALDFPLAWPVAGVVTQPFGPDHPALDIGAPYGSTVYAAAEGKVIRAGWLPTGYGYSIIIDHGDGLQTWYNHLKGTLIGVGSYVSRGDPIAEVGSTGHSTGPHVHFEVRVNGERVDPRDYLPPSPR